MKKLSFLIFVLAACASTKPVPSPAPTPPVVVTHPPADTVFLPGKTDTVTKIVVRDSVVVRTLPVAVNLDTQTVITLAPSGGDDEPQFTATRNYCVQHHIYYIHFAPGVFQFFTKPPILADTTGGAFHQISIGLVGACPAKNTITPDQTVFLDHTKVFGLGWEICEGCTIENIAFVGQYTFPNNLTEVQVDTLTYAQWDDGTCSTNNSSPYAGIAGDFASNSSFYDGVVNKMYPGLESYCFSNMGRGGSTGVEVKNCSIRNFIADFVNSPAYQQNGEMINLDDCNFGNSRSVYCMTNAQQKENHLNRSKIWSPVHTIIDGSHYGANQADGSICPMIDGMNIAYHVHQFINYYSGSHPGGAANVYAEGLHKIGFAGGPANFNFDNCQFNLDLSDAGVPFPDFIVAGGTMTFTNTEVRDYGDSMRIVLNVPGLIFKNGTITNPPICINQEMPQNDSRYPLTKFEDVSMYLSGPTLLNGNGYDSLVPMGQMQLVVNPDFTGYLVPALGSAPTYIVKVGDLLITQHHYGDDYPQYAGLIGSKEYPVGVVSGIAGSTIQLRHISQGLYTGDILTVQNTKIKTQ